MIDWTELGTQILNAMREQGWLVVPDEESGVVILSAPGGRVTAAPLPVFTNPDTGQLRTVLLVWIVADELQWPWPPDFDEDIRGGESPPVGD